MKRWSGGVIIAVLFGLLVFRYVVMESPMAEKMIHNPFSGNNSNPLRWLDMGDRPAVQNPENGSLAVSTSTLVSSLFAPRNLTNEELRSLESWKQMELLASRAEGLPQATEAILEAGTAWKSLMDSIQEKKGSSSGNGTTERKHKERQCPYSISVMNASHSHDSSFKLKIPCGLVQGSSITFIGTPGGLLGDFRIDLTASALPGEPDPPIILHYNVRLHGDKVTEDPVIVQNTWTSSSDWGEEERCPPPDPDDKKTVDELEKCSRAIGKKEKESLASSRNASASGSSPTRKESPKSQKYFPFKQGHIAIAILRVGMEGIQMTVDGKHITSFAYRESLEPWLVNEARISGDIKLISVLASGLPTSEDLEHVNDLELLKSAPIRKHKTLDLFIGVFSTANNFKRRMAVRRTWMQYDVMRTGTVAVRFFVGLHKNEMVNEELWDEARTYGDIQLMPFVDYYSLITWKTIAICIYGTKVVSANFVMKTDDDSFVRVDEVLSSLKSSNITDGLLYGRINSDSQPHRNTDSKWYISHQEWPEDKYPPWAHGPGYVVSRDIAKSIYQKHKKGRLKIFKLEDVAMGIWVAEMKNEGMDILYINEGRIYNEGCKTDYVVAHYQQPREMLCLWAKLQETHHARCCDES